MGVKRFHLILRNKQGAASIGDYTSVWSGNISEKTEKQGFVGGGMA